MFIATLLVTVDVVEALTAVDAKSELVTLGNVMVAVTASVACTVVLPLVAPAMTNGI